MKAIVLLLLLAFAPTLAAQETRQVDGKVYSYVGADGVITYTTTPPPESATHQRTINYRFYEEVGERPPRAAPRQAIGIGRQFGRYTCTQDCSGHRAGYEWAHRRGITHRSRCGGRSQSFIEGCWAYVEERYP